MNSRVLKPKHGPTMLVRPLRNGDVDTVLAVLHRLSEESRRKRFTGSKTRLTAEELWHLARVDATHHALVAYVEGDPDPVAIAQLVRDGQSAEIAFEVANDYQQRGIGSALAEELLADVRAAGISKITALVASDNPLPSRMLRQVLDALDISRESEELWIRTAKRRLSRTRAPTQVRFPFDRSLEWTHEIAPHRPARLLERGLLHTGTASVYLVIPRAHARPRRSPAGTHRQRCRQSRPLEASASLPAESARGHRRSRHARACPDPDEHGSGRSLNLMPVQE